MNLCRSYGHEIGVVVREGAYKLEMMSSNVESIANLQAHNNSGYCLHDGQTISNYHRGITEHVPNDMAISFRRLHSLCQVVRWIKEHDNGSITRSKGSTCSACIFVENIEYEMYNVVLEVLASQQGPCLCEETYANLHGRGQDNFHHELSYPVMILFGNYLWMKLVEDGDHGSFEYHIGAKLGNID